VDLNPYALAGALMVLLALLATGMGLRAWFTGPSPVERRLRAVPASESTFSTAGGAPSGDSLAKALGPIARAAMPMGEEDLGRLRRKMTQAGLRGQGSMAFFLSAKVVLPLVMASGFLWLNARREAPFEPAMLLAVCVFAAAYYAPALWLHSRIRERQQLLERGLPDTLDLLLTCIEAGLGLDVALQRVAGETKLAWPVLGGELELTFLEIKAGIPRVEAFRRLADRTGSSELKSLAGTLAQTEIFGTSVGLALRVQAEGIRTRRMQSAEERAGAVSVRVALPLVLCILPTLFAFVVGPAVIRVASRFVGGGR
jgi:tight adherence protein C